MRDNSWLSYSLTFVFTYVWLITCFKVSTWLSSIIKFPLMFKNLRVFTFLNAFTFINVIWLSLRKRIFSMSRPKNIEVSLIRFKRFPLKFSSFNLCNGWNTNESMKLIWFDAKFNISKLTRPLNKFKSLKWLRKFELKSNRSVYPGDVRAAFEVSR